MPRFEKCLINVAPDAPVDRVARKALTKRLRAVAWYLDAAIGGEGEGEAIHQLRIWTRRSAAALRLFAPAVRERPARRLKKTLRKLRRAAGAVRDCDVHLEQLRADSDHSHHHLIAKLKQQRQRARRELKSRRRRLLSHGRLEHKSAEVLDAIAWPKRHSSREAPDFAPWCRQQLAALAAEFFGLASITPNDDQQLHELRKAGKRLRYALELAAAAIPPRVHRALDEELSALQDHLGAVCDQLVAVQRLRDWRAVSKKPKHRRQLDELLTKSEQRLAAARRQFHRWWSATRRTRWQKKWQAAVS